MFNARINKRMSCQGTFLLSVPFRISKFQTLLRISTFWNIEKIYKDREADIHMMNENDVNYYWREFCMRYEVYLDRIEEI